MMKVIILFGIVLFFVVVSAFIRTILKEMFWNELKSGDSLMVNNITGIRTAEKVLEKHDDHIILEKTGWIDKNQFLYNMDKEYFFADTMLNQ